MSAFSLAPYQVLEISCHLPELSPSALNAFGKQLDQSAFLSQVPECEKLEDPWQLQQADLPNSGRRVSSSPHTSLHCLRRGYQE